MYSHLTKQKRIELGVLLRAGTSQRKIAQLLGVHHSTISRELERNATSRVDSVTGYNAGDAHRRAKQSRKMANQRFRRITRGSTLESFIVKKISKAKWSPEQIAGWTKRFKPQLHVAVQTIYDWIHQFRKDLRIYLHCLKGKLRMTRKGGERRRNRQRQDQTSRRHISNRPDHINRRTRYGHWEGDTVLGGGRSGYIATFVERKSGYLLASLLPKSEFSAIAFSKLAAKNLNKIPEKHRKTLTLDNGTENTAPEAIERRTGVTVYYATPYHSWERGTNENTNGLLRYFFPKKMDFSQLTQTDIDEAVRLLNTRPRKRLGYRTPEQMLRISGAVGTRM